ncbi:dnaJ subfamily B member 4 [Aphelenchoides avenae]|nr:dnaJ subfamily B member 4 [Aphelenchus avenae]
MGNDVGVTSHILEEEENDGEEEDNTTNMTSVKLNANNGEEEVEPQQYEVEQILKSRLVKGKTEYLVHWKGFPSSEDTWEPEANLGASCEGLINALKNSEKKHDAHRTRTKSTAKCMPRMSSSRKKGSDKCKDDSDDSDRDEMKTSKKRRYEDIDDEENDDFEPTPSKKTRTGGKMAEADQDTPKCSTNGGMAEDEGGPADHLGDEDAAQPMVEEASASGNGPPACQVTCLGQLLPRFDIAPYAEGYKRGMLPGTHRDIAVSLEEAYSGCVRRMTINSYDPTYTVKVRVYPGTLAGHQWVYPLPDGTVVTFTLKDARPARFRRDGSDLVYTHRLTLRDALLGARFNVELFTGEVVKLEFGGPVSHGATKRIAGYGLPLPTKPWERGDLVVEFDIKFPNTVSDEYHEAIRQLL